MKYDKKILIAGAHALRRKRVEELHQEQMENFDKEELILQQYNDDQPKIEEIARQILSKAEHGEELTQSDLQDPFGIVTPGERFRTRHLGLDKNRLDGVQKMIEKTERRIKDLEDEPLHIVDFLNAVEDNMVSDYGLKQAGFNISMRELVIAGLEELRNDKSAVQQAAESDT